ncbi:hypothetical protein POTOM_061192 [Populus tomentosa]|uniref:Protein arginine methyltransferase NDUFAF7 n=1 Tax=Populus tomentosa TaxID=118781 RepID=A0A8X7XSC4_POPTO|nr:hypothetical protein POTOM_061192 [Populus tomentosa]
MEMRESQSTRSTFIELLKGKNTDQTPTCTSISIDRSALYNPPEHSHEPTSESELVKHLNGIIKFRGGPISVAEYTEEVLMNPRFGFYINRDVFGVERDFITSPEVSHMFGEGASKFKSFTESLHVPMAECLDEDDAMGTCNDWIKMMPVMVLRKLSNTTCLDEDDASDGVEKRTISILAATPTSSRTKRGMVLFEI